ncbi:MULTISPECIES: alpha/beta hydrolase [unclassified Clostridium]|uniref:alpha/beta fold hydrolase n=1 Tax=unclassified Clostridium TaxID=2614128 RepID=UPI0002972E97|nr:MULTISPECIES: alpha/beta hydrolase [unclassified Clostridium]EKQ51255.1 MAG: putative hydrolase or acyltransferase of alpha/beta superfamily [Clostridium sp. Maddingley MBC34-26]
MSLENSNKLNIGDVTLNYYENGYGENLILLHGNSMDSKSLYKIYNYFSKRYKVIAIDSRGHGLSDYGEIPYSISLFTDDIFAFCKQKGISDICIIGYSDGANIALMLTKKYPKLIKKLIIISGNYKVNGIKKWFIKIIEFSNLLLSPFIKYFKSIKTQKWRFDLMLNDMGISEFDLNQILKPTLILGAENDLIYEKHTLDFYKNIYDSHVKIIKRTNHFNIVRNQKTILAIDEFLNRSNTLL